MSLSEREPAGKPLTRLPTRKAAGLFFICLLLCYDFLLGGVLRWERTTTGRYIAAVASHDAKELDALFWPRHFKPGAKRVVNCWTTDFGDYPIQASSASTRSMEMPSGKGKSDMRLFLLSPVIPVIRHRLAVEIGADGSVVDATYDTHECRFTQTAQSGGSFTNQGLSFYLLIPAPVLLCLAGVSWLLAVASRALFGYVCICATRRHNVAGGGDGA